MMTNTNGVYRKIDVRIHNDAKYRRLSDSAKLLFLTLLTHPNLTSIGAMKMTEAGMAEEMGWSVEAFRDAFREVLKEGLVKYCPEAKFLCLPNFLKYNKPVSVNVVASWKKLEYLLPECSLRDEYIQIVKGYLEGLGEAFLNAFPDGIWNPSPNQETGTGTETETEYKLDHHHHNASADASAFVRHATRPDGSLAFGGCGDSGDNGKGNKTGKRTRKPSGTAIDYPREFLKFWDAYPRKVGKIAALRRWQALRKAGALPDLATLLGALKWQKAQDSWQEDKYIPNPATWLNAGRWADEPPPIDEIDEVNENPDYLKKLADPNCPICHGEGWEPLRENGNHWFKPCLCTKGKRDETITKSRIGKMQRGRYPPDASYS